MLHQTIERKFEEIREVNGEHEVETPNGFKPIKRVMKTIPYQKWYLELEDGYNLQGADTHIVYLISNQEIFLKDVISGDLIETYSGCKRCIRCYTNNEYENMYDIEVDGGIYYSNGVLSHNTTSVSSYIIWYATFNPHKTIAVLANKDDTAKSILDDIKVAYENLPAWLKIGVTEYNAHTIAYENGTKIFCRGTSKDACAGESISFLYLDEFSLIQAYLAEEFYKANYPTISKGEKIVITSTARGIGNLFHKIWKDAIEKTNTYVPFRVDYWEVPEYSVPGWKENMISDIGLIAFNSEYGNQFIGSDTTLISGEALKKLKSKTPIEEKQILGGNERVYENYDSNFKYVASVDIGMGSGNDYSTLNIFKVDYRSPSVEDVKIYQRKDESVPEIIINKLYQSFVFRSNTISIPDFVEYVFGVLKNWGDPFLIFENNGIGQSFLDQMMKDYYYENTYIHEDSPNFGINSSSTTKIEMVTQLKNYCETDRVEIYDTNTINELLTFVERKSSSGNSRYKAEDGSHDDLAVGVGWACFMCNTNWFIDALTF